MGRKRLNQPSYSMFNRWIEEGLLEVLDQQGIGCIVFSPLAQGKLTNRYLNGIPADSRAAKPAIFLQEKDITDEYIWQAQQLNALAQERGQTLAQMAIAWVLRHSGMTSALIGASKVSQIEDCVGALDNLNFLETELQAIDAILSN
jgi:L-glyceraldehyde 3-phosphate reductase